MSNRKANMRNALFLLIVLFAATIYYFFFSQGGITFGFSQEQNQIVLQGGAEEAYTISLSDIQELEYIEVFDPGEAAGGTKSWQGVCAGTWQNDSLGTYEAFLTARVKSAIIVKTQAGTVAFSLENDQTMESLYEQLYDYYLQHK